jgi:hypothetical protein
MTIIMPLQKLKQKANKLVIELNHPALSFIKQLVKHDKKFEGLMIIIQQYLCNHCTYSQNADE